MTLGVNATTASVSKQDVLAELITQLRTAIEGIEQTTVTFDNLGPSPSLEASSARRLGFELAEPTIFLGASPQDDARYPGANPGSVLAANPTVAVGDIEVVVEELQQSPDFANTPTPSTSIGVSVAPEPAEGEAAPAVPRARTIRVTATADSEQGAQDAVAIVAAVMEENARAITNNFATRFVLVQSTVGTATSGVEEAPSSSRLPVNIVLGLILGAAAGIGYALWSSGRDGIISTPRAFERSARCLTHRASSPTRMTRTLQRPVGSGFWHCERTCCSGWKPQRLLRLFHRSRGRERTRSVSDLLVHLRPRHAGWHSWIATGDASVSTDASIVNQQDENLVYLPADRLGDFRQVHDRLTELSQDFDHVLVLCPPAASDPAAAEITARCTSTLLVVRAGITTAAEVDITARILLQTSTAIGGVVVNSVPPADVFEWARSLPAAPPPNPSDIGPTTQGVS